MATERPRSLRARLERLERGSESEGLEVIIRTFADAGDESGRIVTGFRRVALRPLPLALPDETPAAGLERLRAASIEAVHFGEFVEECVAGGDDARA